MLNTTHEALSNSRTLASIDFSGLTFGPRKAYMREETSSERIWREEAISKYVQQYSFRLTVKFEDDSVKNFRILSDNKEATIIYDHKKYKS